MGGIILFDGECNFCNASVQFIIKRDAPGYFRFASLQSDIGRQLVLQYGISPSIDSLILIEQEHAYIRSTAALKIARRLQGVWRCCYVAIIIPLAIRDVTYNIFARNRYRWFGKKESCMIPSSEQRSRFL
ncbi:thiol-disulfide oxidoreductase DCC family protein [Solibacillus sp. FSL H8-0538]|uniref:thiol-disulfide oxidoreductase DCC family protein n=1 Tax=Solibacillus sp. FSL H8-0538 TaxID=2921400 RepID=UPI0030F5F708